MYKEEEICCEKRKKDCERRGRVGEIQEGRYSKEKEIGKTRKIDRGKKKETW